MRCICLIVDALGIGQMADVPTVPPANTLLNVCLHGRAFHLPNLERLGLGNIAGVPCVKPAGNAALASWGKMELGYDGADTYMGHQILMGTGLLKPQKKTIRQLGPAIAEHLQKAGHEVRPFPGQNGPLLVDGRMAVADCMEAAPGLSLNVTASLRDVPLDHVLKVARLVRECVTVTRVIVVASGKYGTAAIGEAMIERPAGGAGVDTPRLCRLDEQVTLRHLGLPLDLNGQCPTQVAKTGVPVYLIGKAADVVQCDHENATSLPLVDSRKIFECVKRCAQKQDDYLIVANIQETDLSGHAQDILRWADLLELIDAEIPSLLELLGDEGAFLLTGDHGNDPYLGGGLHTREMTPCLFYSPLYRPRPLGVRKTLADIGATISDLFGTGPTQGGASLLPLLEPANAQKAPR